MKNQIRMLLLVPMLQRGNDYKLGYDSSLRSEWHVHVVSTAESRHHIIITELDSGYFPPSADTRNDD